MKNRVRFFRKAKHWTQADLAARVGVNRENASTPSRKGAFCQASPSRTTSPLPLKAMSTTFFHPRVQLRPLPQSSSSSHQLQPAASRDSSFHSGGLK